MYNDYDNMLMLAQAEDSVQGPQIEQGDAAPDVSQPANGQAVEGQNGAAEQGQQPPADQEQTDQGNPLFLFLMIGMVVLFFIMIFGGQRRERKRHQEMLSNLKKGDKIRTNAGIFGTVMEIRDDEILVKVDENTNTRLRMAPQAIASVESQGAGT